jgi:hypothetical protein
MGGTPDFLMDPRRGLYSYSALQTRLAENAFAVDGLVDYSGPIIRLPGLTPEDLFVLLCKLRHVQASGDPEAYLMPDDGIQAYMAHCQTRIGNSYFRTPRTSIKSYLDLLAVLEQNPDRGWVDLVGTVQIAAEVNPDLEPIDGGSESDGWAESAPAASNGPRFAAALSVASTQDDDDLTAFRL